MNTDDLIIKIAKGGAGDSWGIGGALPVTNFGAYGGSVPVNDPPSGGIKHDAEKPRVDLVSSSWLLGVAQVLTFGARKYDSHNWRKGLACSRLMAAAMRHLLAYNSGEDLDTETGLLHLYHASCCLMFMSELHFTHPETDDRYKSVVKEEILK